MPESYTPLSGPVIDIYTLANAMKGLPNPREYRDSMVKLAIFPPIIFCEEHISLPQERMTDAKPIELTFSKVYMGNTIEWGLVTAVRILTTSY